MHVSTLQCGHLLWFDRYLNDFQVLPRVYQHVTCYKLDCFNDTLSQISQVSNFSAVHVINKPHAKKSSGVKSGDLGGQAVGSPLPTQRPGNVSSRNVVTFLWK
jgi:hypothetical protein